MSKVEKESSELDNCEAMHETPIDGKLLCDIIPIFEIEE